MTRHPPFDVFLSRLFFEINRNGTKHIKLLYNDEVRPLQIIQIFYMTINRKIESQPYLYIYIKYN